MNQLSSQGLKSEIENMGGRLIAVSKTFSVEQIKSVHARLEVFDFGENYLNEASAKIDVLSDLNLRWHFIGRLQKGTLNKVLNRFYLIHSIAKLSHLEIINKKTIEKQRVLIQLKHGQDERDYGVLGRDLISFVEKALEMKNIELHGLMFLPPPNLENESLNKAFLWAKHQFDNIGERFPELSSWSVLSMGMSSDYQEALQRGATHVRLGRAIFGER